jgi:hypothetical protein
MSPALIALVVLLLLPGLLVVRAPWTTAPALSLAFWALSIWWPGLAGLSRGRVTASVLLVSLLLLAIRALPKHETLPAPGGTALPSPEPAPRPGLPTPRLTAPPTLALLLVALALVAAASLWRHAPGPGMAFQTTTARLVLWRDGIPLSAEPLLPLGPFGAHAPALATIGADLAALSGGDPARGVLLVYVTAIALLLLGLFMLEASWLPPGTAALGALSGLAVAQGLDWLALWGRGEAALCLGFVLPAAALWLGHVSRSSAIAAGMLFAAGLVAQPLLAAVVWASCALALLARRSRRALGRLALVSGAAAVLGAFGALPALSALSARELRAILSFPARELAAFLGGCLALLLGAVLARRLAQERERLALAGCLFAGALLVAPTHTRIRDAQLPVAGEQALARLAAASGPLDALCAPAPLLDWVPALVGRAAGEPGPWIPAVYQDEWAARVPRRCQVSLADRQSASRRAGP